MTPRPSHKSHVRTSAAVLTAALVLGGAVAHGRGNTPETTHTAQKSMAAPTAAPTSEPVTGAEPAQLPAPSTPAGKEPRIETPTKVELPPPPPQAAAPAHGGAKLSPPAPAPPAAPALPAPGQARSGDEASKGTVEGLIRSTFPQEEWSRALRVATCESGLRNVSSKPNRDGSRDHGIFQLNDDGTLQGLLTRLGHAQSEHHLALDPTWNVRAAKVLWTERGWAPWTCAHKEGIVARLWSNEKGPNW